MNEELCRLCQSPWRRALAQLCPRTGITVSDLAVGIGFFFGSCAAGSGQERLAEAAVQGQGSPCQERFCGSEGRGPFVFYRAERGDPVVVQGACLFASRAIGLGTGLCSSLCDLSAVWSCTCPVLVCYLVPADELRHSWRIKSRSWRSRTCRTRTTHGSKVPEPSSTNKLLLGFVKL